MDTYHLALRHALEAEWVFVAEVKLGGERELYDIIDALDVLGLYAHLIHLSLVKLCILVTSLYDLLESLALKSAHVLAAHALILCVVNHCCFFQITEVIEVVELIEPYAAITFQLLRLLLFINIGFIIIPKKKISEAMFNHFNCLLQSVERHCVFLAVALAGHYGYQLIVLIADFHIHKWDLGMIEGFGGSGGKGVALFGRLQE